MAVEFIAKTISSLSGNFRLPGYQRGYRWTSDEIERLLDDLFEWNENSPKGFYYLQPIVVKNLGKNADGIDEYELIDGQQRLTTIYLILLAIKKWLPAPDFYSLSYDTRPESLKYLESLGESPEMAEVEKNRYIDFRYLHNAYNCILDWIGTDSKDALNKAIKLYNLLCDKVKVLWYEASDREDGHELFKRLNIGRIPLTNAELVKALFLNRDSIKGRFMGEKSLRQDEIATQWEHMERQLQDESFWAFLTNEKGKDYPSRLELVFDFMSGKRKSEREKYYTFFYFSDRIYGRKEGCSGMSLTELWKEIVNFYDRLRLWYENRELYNRAGTLVIFGEKLPAMIEATRRMRNTERIKYLEGEIIRLIPDSDKLLSLRYGKDSAELLRVLTWFNVKTIDNSRERFPFDKFKEGSGWSLEHIHAQNSEGLGNEKQWHTWIDKQKEALYSLPESSERNLLIKEATEAVSLEAMGRPLFESLFIRITEMLSARLEDDDEDANMHSIRNLALLQANDNAALNNSVFEAKRKMIGDLDRKGHFIPVCTRNVFTKYYTPASDNQLYFWGDSDREAYLDMICKTIY